MMTQQKKSEKLDDDTAKEKNFHRPITFDLSTILYLSHHVYYMIAHSQLWKNHQKVLILKISECCL